MKNTPLDIPEARSGKHSIRHVEFPADTVFNTTTARSMIIGGQRNRQLQWRVPTRFHELCEDDQGVWMTDLPPEQAQLNKCIEPMTGSVLVGGLGLGLAATVLAERPTITSIKVVEISPDVIALVKPHLIDPRRKVSIVLGDIQSFVESHRRDKRFTWAFFDTWQSDGEGTLFDVVIPMVRAAKGLVVNRPVCWNEDVMRGQLALALRAGLSALHFTLPDAKLPTLDEQATVIGNRWHDWKVPFFEWVRDKSPHVDELEVGIDLYAGAFGDPGFPQVWDSFRATTGAGVLLFPVEQLK